jgi:hypothetical protein
VVNRATDRQQAVLQQEMSIVMDGDPMAMYVEKMMRSAESEGSQLGLARIRCEGQADLALSLDGDAVCLTAVFQVPEADHTAESGHDWEERA